MFKLKRMITILLMVTAGWLSLATMNLPATEGRANEPVSYITDRDSFLKALPSTERGDTVYVAARAEIDLTGLVNIIVPAGVSIVGLGGSERKGDYADYPLFYTDSVPGRERINALLVAGGDGIVISGIRLQGSYGKDSINDNPDIPGSVGFMSSGFDGIIIDDCEVFNWHFSGILFDHGSRDNLVKNSYIHNNKKPSYGYGVCVSNDSFAVIEYNRFDYNRHDIAGNGTPGTGYTARYNYVGKNGTSHSFDMHGGADRRDGTDYAGCCIIIENNEFHVENHWAIAIRGIPKKYAIVRDNTFYTERNHLRNSSIKQVNAYGNVYAGPNNYKYDFREIEANGWVVLFAGSDKPEMLFQTNYSFANVRIGDFNGDGISDIFVLDSAGRWRVSWSALVSWQHLNDVPGRDITIDDIYIGDFNGDGKDDVLVRKDNSLYLAENGRGEPAFTAEIEAEASELYICDFNGDGVSDILYYTSERWIALTDKLLRKNYLTMPFEGLTIVKTGDFNGNGKAEIFFEDNNRVYYSSAGNIELLPNILSIADIALHDFTGDGKNDLFFADGERWYILSYGETEAKEIRRSQLRRKELLFADFNGDGKTDIVFKK